MQDFLVIIIPQSEDILDTTECYYLYNIYYYVGFVGTRF